MPGACPRGADVTGLKGGPGSPNKLKPEKIVVVGFRALGVAGVVFTALGVAGVVL